MRLEELVVIKEIVHQVLMVLIIVEQVEEEVDLIHRVEQVIMEVRVAQES
tara:strand:+ start:474 stop:623 length:150 start_codon:yes stop_codon:yes gene_type:complete